MSFEDEKMYFKFYASRNGKRMKVFLNMRTARKSNNKTSSNVKYRLGVGVAGFWKDLQEGNCNSQKYTH